jgi:hypothetical protein
LTLGVSSGNLGSVPSIESLALSADGSTLAFTSTRDDFVLPEPRPIGTFRPFPSGADLYVVHLAESTLQRAVVSVEGSDPEGSISINPSLTQNGSTVAFTSSVPNLIFGDANQSSDAFTASAETAAGTDPPSAEVNAIESGFSLSATATAELGVHVKRTKGSGLIVLVETPGPGRVSVDARGLVQTRIRGRVKGRKVLLAHSSGVARAEGTTTLTLRLVSRYSKQLKRVGKLRAAIVVHFTPSSSPADGLSAEASATFTRQRHT